MELIYFVNLVRFGEVMRTMLLSVLLCFALTISAYGADCPNYFFSVAKSDNANVLYYAPNLAKDGTLASRPVEVYWLMHADDGRKEALTWMEKPHLDVTVKDIVKGKNYTVNLRDNKLKSRDINIMLDIKGCAMALTEINDRYSYLDEIFVHVETKGRMIPKIHYVEIKGRSWDSLESISEKIYN